MRKLFILPVLLLLLLSSCDAQGTAEHERSLCVATWNLQNLFDAKSDGNEYEEYDSSSGWSQSMYESRLTNVRKVLDSLPGSGDYILILNEVEGLDVVDDLIKTNDLMKLGLHWFACTAEPDLPVQIAVVSSIPIADAHVHSVGEDLRPILEVGFDTDGGRVFILACHFKSNVGGVSETESQRLQAATVVSQIARNLEAENPGALVLVCGDLNEECWNGPALSADGPLPCSGQFGRGQWFCFWRSSEVSVWPGGSYWYDGSWRCYDNILVSLAGCDGTGWDFSEAGVLFEAFQRTADGKPFAWDRRLLKGISDHLPVWVKLKLQ